jgi:hypothetical protein
MQGFARHSFSGGSSLPTQDDRTPRKAPADGLGHQQVTLRDAPVAHRDRQRQGIDAAEVLPWSCTVTTTRSMPTPIFWAVRVMILRFA